MDKPEQKPPKTPRNSDPSRSDRISKIVEACVLNAQGLDADQLEAIINENADLMPELGEQLMAIGEVKSARNMAKQLGDENATVSDGSSDEIANSTKRMSRQIEIDGYKLIREIGRGGQAIVYLAKQESTGRRVAIKVLHERIDIEGRQQERFEREVQILAALNHPNIVAVVDKGIGRQGNCYFVMEYVEGIRLDQYLSDHNHVEDDDAEAEDPSERLRLFMKICDAVNAAHLRGIVHRDLKPSNILIDERNEPRILDFGLARTAMPSALDGSGPEPLTITGQFLGSLAWASPEQAEGKPDKIDSRTDVYSLGVILYQMLTGTFPYEVVGNMVTVLQNILTAEPTPPSKIIEARLAKSQRLQRNRRAVLKNPINGSIEAIVLKALAKNRQDRYQNAGEFSQDIAKYLSGKSIAADGESRTDARKTKARIAAAVVGVGVLLAIVFFVPNENGQPSGFSNDAGKGKATNGTGSNSSLTTPSNGKHATALSPDRRVAEWIFSIGGRIQVGQKAIPDKSQLPDGRFELNWISIVDCDEFTDDAARELTVLKHLKSLGISNVPMGDAGLEQIGKLKTLTGFNVTDVEVTDKGLAHIAGLTRLTQLNLSRTLVSGAGMVHLENMNRLEILWLIDTYVNDRGLISVSKLTNLHTLGLDGTEISDAGIPQLMSLKNMVKLNLFDTKIGDESARMLATLPKLKELWLAGTNVTRACIEELREKYPHCRFVWN